MVQFWFRMEDCAIHIVLYTSMSAATLICNLRESGPPIHNQVLVIECSLQQAF